eukprot:319975-Chlamydomonas_euryale.AAC.1
MVPACHAGQWCPRAMQANACQPMRVDVHRTACMLTPGACTRPRCIPKGRHFRHCMGMLWTACLPVHRHGLSVLKPTPGGGIAPDSVAACFTEGNA